MKYPSSRRTENEGVLYVESVVNLHGSVFRRVHQETDLGVDGFIELIRQEQTSGRLIAVQIKSGESYLSSSGDAFAIHVDERHLEYWASFMVPVIMIGYSPIRRMAAWTSIRDYIASETYQRRLPIREIRIPFREVFDVPAVETGVSSLAHIRADERILLKCADKCLSSEAQERYDGFQILTQHPDSRKLKIVCQMSRQLLMDDRGDTARNALEALGYGVGRGLFSWSPGNAEERDVISFAHELCQTLSEREILRCLALVDDDAFGGPHVLGTYCYLVLQACWDRAEKVLWDVIQDTTQPFSRRANAFWIYYDCETNDMMLDHDERKSFLENPVLSPLYLYWFRNVDPDQ